MAGYIGNAPVPQATQTRDTFTATEGQTSFPTSGYTPNYLDVYLNGVKLPPEDFTATNGSDVVLDTGAAVNDVLEVVAFSTFEVQGDINADSVTTGTFTSNGIDDNATSTAMTLDSSGNLLVGKTVTDNNTAGLRVEGNGLTAATRDGGFPALFNRLTSDGEIVSFRKDGSAVGSIGANSGRSYFSSDNGATGSGIKPTDTGTIATYRGGSDANAIFDLGSSGVRWKDLYLSGGVYLGGTGAANKLDDYESGTWAPEIKGSTSGSLALSIAQASYTKIGNTVTVQCFISSSSGSLTGQLRMYGLPFNASEYNVASVTYCNMFTDYPVIGFTEGGANYINLMRGSSTSAVDSVTYSGSGTMMLTVTYFTSA